MHNFMITVPSACIRQNLEKYEKNMNLIVLVKMSTNRRFVDKKLKSVSATL